ncbi:MAG: hypothetical protein K1X75_06150 [Leptospirales bacterium]|nr:hypothetical protein [Leptospirales bacterium]
MNRWRAAALSALLFVGCIPMENPDDSALVPTVLALLATRPSPDVVPIQLVDTLFPTEGPYALIAGEREAIQYAMYDRYTEGFYEPEFQEMMAADMVSTMEYARQEDGTTFESLQQELIADVTKQLPKLPVPFLYRVRYMCANSAIMTHEIADMPGFTDHGLDADQMQKSTENMLALYRQVSDELRRRGELQGADP